ncbi:MAG TPA: aminopeptidase P family protein [Lentisphaeria bacterium]|nr:MAG: hypothetical protein A2X47_07290 [Lentisphaerae bacterium GWF2_38_69]HBM15565.1 aminopeptidase P family protein [Lentisphaeria bacterium]
MTRKSTGKIIFADSLTNPDILYASGFMSHDAFLYFEVNRKKYIVLSSLELERASCEANKEINIINREDFLSETNDKSVNSLFREIILQYKQDKWIVPYNFPVLYSKIFKNSLSICKEEFFPKRNYKNKKEIKEISKALAVAEKAMSRAETILAYSSVNNKLELVYDKKPLTSEFLKNEINLEIVRNGAHTHGTIASSGLQCAIPHNTGSGIIKANLPIIIDIFPRLESTGYWGDITRTFVKGKVQKHLKQAYDAIKLARDNAISKIKPGAIPSVLHSEATEDLVKKGFKTGRDSHGKYFGFFHGLGHGVGLEIHENPRVNALATIPLETGNVITIEPGIYYPEWGGVRLEDLIVVTKNGAENLTKYPNILEID